MVANKKRGLMSLNRSNVQAGSRSSLSESGEEDEEDSESMKSEGKKINKPSEIKVETSTILPALGKNTAAGLTKSLESITDENVKSLN